MIACEKHIHSQCKHVVSSTRVGQNPPPVDSLGMIIIIMGSGKTKK